MSRSERFAWAILVGCAAVATAGCLAVAGSRIGHPFELEWMEGAMVDHAARVAEGRPLYCAPGPEHVPFLYTPLLFWAGGALMWLGLDGLFALRALSALATVALALLIGHWVRRETGRIAAGLVATGLLFGGYGYLAFWYDLARNDTSCVLGVVAAAWLLRRGGRGTLPLAVAAATLAFLAKQTALMWLPAIGAGALLLDRRRGLIFCGAAAAAIGGAVLAMHLATDGWSTFYVFQMPRSHGIEASRKLGFWTEDVVPMLPLLALGIGGFAARWRRERGGALFLAAFGSGGIVASWLSRLHVGGFDNVLLFAFTAACVLGPVAAATASGPPWRRAALSLLLLQFVLLVFDVRSVWSDRLPILFEPQRALPSVGHRRAHEELLAFVRSVPGPVLVPMHGNVTALAGKPRMAHAQAMFDLLQGLGGRPPAALLDPAQSAAIRAPVRAALRTFYERMLAVLQQGPLDAIVLDAQHGGVFEELFAGGLRGRFERQPRALLTEPAALQAPIGLRTNSPYALERRR